MHSIVSVSLVAFASALLVASSAHAAGGGGDATKTVAWQAFNLAVLFGVLFWFARKPVSAFFADRRSGIQHDLAEAARLLSEAETRNSELQRRLVDLGSEIEEIRENARRRAEEESERILAEAGKAAERIRSDASAAIDQELRRARMELRDEAASAALEAAAEILREKIAEGDRDRLLDEFITRVEPPNA
jgi:F-type H+-transporting ATPase subunit b